MFLLPGGVPILLNIRSYTVITILLNVYFRYEIFNRYLLKVVQDCIEQICAHLGVQNSLEQLEYSIYYVVEAGLKTTALIILRV